VGYKTAAAAVNLSPVALLCIAALMDIYNKNTIYSET